MRLALLLVVLGTGCGRQETASEIAIGLAANTGRPSMRSVLRGTELAVAHLNAGRPEGSPPFVLRTVSDKLTGAVDIATALRDDESVVGVVGHTDSGGSLEAAAVYGDAEHDGKHAVVAISPTATSPVLSGRSEWMFRVCPSDLAASRAAARYALDSLRARRAVIMYRNDLYGKGWSRAFTEAFRAGGGTVLRRDPHLTGMTEWRPYALHIRKLDPDIVLFPGSPQDIEPFLRELRAAGVHAPVLGGDAVSELEARGAEFSGTYYTAFFLPRHAPGEAGRTFVDAYRTAYGGEVPDQRAALAYDAAILIGQAAMAVGPSRRAVRDHIAGTGTTRPALQGVTGPIVFDAMHDVVEKPVVIARVGR